MTENTLNLQDRLSIIKNASIDDVKILNTNYKHLILNTPDVDEKKQFIILQTNTQLRIKELTH
jgi:protein tyrosine phosphatase (PTP) superfamily phosphohydrolase (DUF442 family)